MPFSTLGLSSSSLLKVLAEQKYAQPYPIQKRTIPAIINKKDVLGIAQTGSGKTAGYVLPILTNLEGKVTSRNRYVKVLVVVPTRELAMQVQEVFELFASAFPKPPKSFAVYGGVSINPQMMNLNRVEILIATPGRLLELVESKAVYLSEINTLVLDEADKMLNMGFEEEMNKIFALLPRKRQNLLFSATLNENLENIHRVLLHQPEVIKIEPEVENIDLIKQVAYFVSEEKKGPLLRYLIKENNMQQVLVFVSSAKKADNVTNKLTNNGVDARAIHSKKSQNARIEALSKFAKGKTRVLVTTDLLARGIDIKFLPFVINYELPRSPKDYVHRIGRTGRAESSGEAISLVTPEEQHHFKIIQKKVGKIVEVIDSESFDLQGF